MFTVFAVEETEIEKLTIDNNSVECLSVVDILSYIYILCVGVVLER